MSSLKALEATAPYISGGGGYGTGTPLEVSPLSPTLGTGPW